MIEVLFGECEAESLRIAIKKGVISGSAEKVICIASMLDIGDIREKIDSTYRLNLIFDMYTQNGYDNSEKTIKEIKNVGRQYIGEQNRLMNHVLKGEQIRIWYSNSPHDICGFYYICNILKDVLNEVFTVKLPEYIQIQDSILSYQGWGEIVPENFATIIRDEKKISQIERIMFSNNWLELVEDNSPLRSVVNGQLVGVPLDFYDYWIYKCIGFEPIKEVQLIGHILSKYILGVGDWWYASRIEYLINNNKIKIVEDSANKYERTIAKV